MENKIDKSNIQVGQNGIEKRKNQVKPQIVIKNQYTKLDPNQPVPVEFTSTYFRTKKGMKYIPFLGADDNLANIFLAARLASSSQNACIGSIAQSLIGKGIKVKDVETPNAQLVEWMKSVNNYRHSFNELLVGTVDGERTFGNQFIEVVRGEVAGKRFLKIYNKSIMTCRLAAQEDDSAEEQYVLVSNSFNSTKLYTTSNKDADLQIPIWHPNPLTEAEVWKQDGKVERTMIHFKNEISGIPWYGLPASVAGLRYQILEAKAAQFNIDNFDNNMILGGMLIFKASMTPEEAQANAKEILMTHIGEGKTGRIAVISSEEGINEVDFKPYSTQREASYNESDKRWEEKIISANQWDSVLAGINRSSNFGNGSQYIRSIWDVKDAVLLHPLREKLIAKVIKPILEIWADWFNVPDVAKYEYSLQTNMPFSFMGDLDPNTFFQLNEARQKAGLPPDDVNGKKYLSEMRPKNNSNNNVQNNPTDNFNNPQNPPKDLNQ